MTPGLNATLFRAYDALRNIEANLMDAETRANHLVFGDDDDATDLYKLLEIIRAAESMADDMAAQRKRKAG